MRSDEPVFHQSRKRFEFKRPDRIYGLRMTRTLKQYTSAWAPSTRHSPLKDHDGPYPCLYPFLVEESKSEKGGPGFEAIEAQTAFSIKSCLTLQSQLENDSGVPLHPLVWFIACQGDDWRLYAAIPRDEGVVG